MKIDKSLQEVWDWKAKVYEGMKGLNDKGKIVEFKRSSDEFCRKFNVQFKKVSMTHK